MEVDLGNALSISSETNLYAYDAYYLECATRRGAPLLTLDRALQRAASHMGIDLVEI